MLLVNGEKMSKSLGNFITVREALSRASGEVIRFLLVRSHYRSTLDFTDAALLEAKRELDRFYRALKKHESVAMANKIPDSVLEPLLDDLNTPLAISGLHALADAALIGDENAAAGLKAAGQVLGIFNNTEDEWFSGGIDQTLVDDLVTQRIVARKNKNFSEADRIRDVISAMGIIIEDGPNGTYSLRKV
jgi:cysteinyl-tRNA synthetase